MSEEIVNKGLELLKTGFTLAQNETPKLMSEFINYLIFSECMSLVFKFIIFMIAMNIVKLFSINLIDLQDDLNEAATAAKTCDKSEQRWRLDRVYMCKKSLKEANTFKKIVFTAITIIFVTWSISSLETIGKLLIAPKIYMIKEGVEHLQPKSCTQCGKKE